jgi:hypothetical protein
MKVGAGLCPRGRDLTESVGSADLASERRHENRVAARRLGGCIVAGRLLFTASDPMRRTRSMIAALAIAAASFACSNGSTTLAAGQSNPEGIAVDATGVYWTNNGPSWNSGTVMKVPIAGGAVSTLAAGQGLGDGIAVDSTSVYWPNLALSADGGLPLTFTVMKIPVGGGTPTPVVPAESLFLQAPTPSPCVAVSGSNIFWTSSFQGGTVMTAAASGGPATTLATDQIGAFGIAVDANSVYWANYNGTTIVKVPIGGGTPTTLASGPLFPWNIVVDTSNVYWTTADFPAGTVMAVPIGGGAPTTLASEQNSPQGIAIDATSIYWTNAGTGPKNFTDGQIMKVAIAGGTPTTLASDQTAPFSIAVDAVNVYWTNFGSGTVMKMPK